MPISGAELVLVCCILDFGQGSKALALAREAGAVGETVFLGRGTVKDKWLKLLGATDVRKEILVTIADKTGENNLYTALVNRFNLTKPQRGIAFSLPLKYCLPSAEAGESPIKDVRTVAYEAIFVIVDKGLAVEVIEAAESAGSTGGTVIHGRGSGTQEKARLFNIEIEPEKDIVLILSRQEKTAGITAAIDKQLKISEPGAGIVFVLAVTRTVGLYEG